MILAQREVLIVAPAKVDNVKAKLRRQWCR
jgi:hypothetical protein